MWAMRRVGVRLVLLGVLVAALAMLGAACGGSPTSTTGGPTTSATLPPLPTPAGADTIAVNYVQFFDGTRPVADKIGLLENGQQYAEELEAQAASPSGKTASITISSVTITSATTAEVKFSILVSGEPAFPDQTGKAILQDGVWKVGAETFLALLALQQGSTTQPS
jgi:flagellar basal body-associated protein FliL